ncbi:hypothetical protein PP506_gp13 [Gordonia phage DobbysSock]|uniref:Uncharacterized protein n=3 Tax=Beenievirus TaxID=3044673 RepID=A0A5P8DAV5_9CAUD|nr:hypothetical protein PP506_gp13 [Gordonia phage DobbysSock]QFP96134.1 hypothetical protein DOBBYSSOCK_SEA_13 [Gordonia phage DobbysSock]
MMAVPESDLFSGTALHLGGEQDTDDGAPADDEAAVDDELVDDGDVE